MRRQAIQLLAAARQGDVHARLAAGRGYLSGTGTFPRHVQTALSYLSTGPVATNPDAAVAIAEGMHLDELIAHHRECDLAVAAEHGSAEAVAKQAVLALCNRGQHQNATQRLRTAAHRGSLLARHVLRSISADLAEPPLHRVLLAACEGSTDRSVALACSLARRAMSSNDDVTMHACIEAACESAETPDEAVDELVAHAVWRAEQRGIRLTGIPPRHVEAALERRAVKGDARAALTLGKALCAQRTDNGQQSTLTPSNNMRRASALLMRAAHAGSAQAWLVLYRLHTDNRASVANAGLARFCLEKAAAAAIPEAQRRLGIYLLREAACLGETELALHWLHRAADMADVSARCILDSLVLPIAGTEADAVSAIDAMKHHDPWLAYRMRLSRDFGLTRMEALTLDPCEGQRPWGVVVGPRPFLARGRMAAPRAVPAVSRAALENLRLAASAFMQGPRQTPDSTAEWHRRARSQRAAFARLEIDEALFFATVTPTALDVLRRGPKWAHRERQRILAALA